MQETRFVDFFSDTDVCYEAISEVHDKTFRINVGVAERFSCKMNECQTIK
jgi:hypothetical protein